MSSNQTPAPHRNNETRDGEVKEPPSTRNASNGQPRSASNIGDSSNKSRTIGNYILGKTLGEGTFGKVKIAIHTITGEKVAVKILEKDKIQDASDVERITREIQILKVMRHPHVIQLYEIIETPKNLYLVMEYSNGGELFDYIVASTRVKEKEACRFFHQIISGIEYIHKVRIVHRDMKPENLLLDHNKNIKIADFGLSNMYKEGEVLKTACGSPCYAAPEMIAGKKYVGLEVDIWSCGVVLYALVCGYLPFEDSNTSVLYKKIMAGDYSIPKFLSSEAKDLIKNILTTDPTKRYKIDDIRRHPWYQLYKPRREPEGIFVADYYCPVDSELLKEIEAKGFNSQYAIKCIEANKHNSVTSTYYLIMKRNLINGVPSKADLNSENFDKALIQPKSKKKSDPGTISANTTNRESESRMRGARTNSSGKKSATAVEAALPSNTRNEAANRAEQGTPDKRRATPLKAAFEDQFENLIAVAKTNSVNRDDPPSHPQGSAHPGSTRSNHTKRAQVFVDNPSYTPANRDRGIRVLDVMTDVSSPGKKAVPSLPSVKNDSNPGRKDTPSKRMEIKTEFDSNYRVTDGNGVPTMSSNAGKEGSNEVYIRRSIKASTPVRKDSFNIERLRGDRPIPVFDFVSPKNDNQSPNRFSALSHNLNMTTQLGNTTEISTIMTADSPSNARKPSENSEFLNKTFEIKLYSNNTHTVSDKEKDTITNESTLSTGGTRQHNRASIKLMRLDSKGESQRANTRTTPIPRDSSKHIRTQSEQKKNVDLITPADMGINNASGLNYNNYNAKLYAQVRLGEPKPPSEQNNVTLGYRNKIYNNTNLMNLKIRPQSNQFRITTSRANSRDANANNFNRYLNDSSEVKSNNNSFESSNDSYFLNHTTLLNNSVLKNAGNDPTSILGATQVPAPPSTGPRVSSRIKSRLANARDLSYYDPS